MNTGFFAALADPWRASTEYGDDTDSDTDPDTDSFCDEPDLNLKGLLVW